MSAIFVRRTGASSRVTPRKRTRGLGKELTAGENNASQGQEKAERRKKIGLGTHDRVAFDP